MTQRITEKMINLQLEIAITNTALNLSVGGDSGTYYLKVDGQELSKRGTKTEIYNILYTLNNVLDHGRTFWQLDNILTKEKYEQLEFSKLSKVRPLAEHNLKLKESVKQ